MANCQNLKLEFSKGPKSSQEELVLRGWGRNVGDFWKGTHDGSLGMGGVGGRRSGSL